MKKIFYSAFVLLLSTAMIASGQKVVDLSIELKEPSADFVKEKDSLTLSYVIKNNGPDALEVGDTLFFHDPLIKDDQIWYVILEVPFEQGDEENITDRIHFNQIKTLYMNNGTAVSPPFAPGTYTFGVMVADKSSVFQDPNLSNNFSTVSVTIKPTNIDVINNAQREFKLFPTHVNNGVINLELNMSELTSVSYKIVDLKGATVLSHDLGNVSMGKQANEINVKTLSAGTYLFQLNAHGKSYTQQIVVTQ